MDQRYTAAIELLKSFELNAPVRVVLPDGKPNDMYVSRTMHRADHAFGSPESSRVTVTYGPGRYACDVTADMLVLGTASIAARTSGTPVVEEIMDLLKSVDETVCFCGEDIDYDKPGDEGGEFIGTEQFFKDHPKCDPNSSVIAHAECGLGAGLVPA